MKELYAWIIFFIVVVGIAIGIRFLYAPLISIKITITPDNATIYPYLPIRSVFTIANTGHSPITNMSVGVYVNGTLNMLYRVTLPQGKQTQIVFNYTPSYPGNYTIQAVADPGRLYDIADRAEAQAEHTYTVLANESLKPYLMLPYENASKTEQRFVLLKAGAYAFTEYLNATYGIDYAALTNNALLNSFLNTTLGYVLPYISGAAVAEVNYSNGNAAYALWLHGYISSNITNVAAAIAGINSTNISINGKQVTFARLSKNLTVCSYYSKGLIKMLAYASKNSTTCIGALSMPRVSGIALSRFYNFTVSNAIQMGAISLVNNSLNLSGTYALLNGTFVGAYISNMPVNTTCYGLITHIGNESYCSEYIFPVTGHVINNVALIRTTAGINGYNASVFSLQNQSLLLSEVPENIKIIKGMPISGKYVQFASGIKGTCSFNSTFTCQNVSFLNGTLSLNITPTNTLRLNSLSCYISPPGQPTMINKTLQQNTTVRLAASCYNDGTKLYGFALNLHLNLVANYTINNVTKTVLGEAYIPIT